ncbi:M48 family metallopeptidase [Candidatus Saccharibacteria bacterium]|nr:M48 family metallopeptidase [Candidatus Saccharibacteria bacterium]
MAQKRVHQVHIDDIGDVFLTKRRGSRSLRISISADGKVRIGLPYWASYNSAISYAKERRNWIVAHMSGNPPSVLKNNQRIGKAHTLYFVSASNSTPKSQVTKTAILLKSNLVPTDEQVQVKARSACEQALKNEALVLLSYRLKELADRYGFEYSSLRIRKLTSRWGSCSSKRSITLSYFLMQLPWELIDYVILHELVHTKYLNHSPQFWQTLETLAPQAKKKQKIVRAHKPRIEPWSL